jgi:hypothetical protein
MNTKKRNNEPIDNIAELPKDWWKRENAARILSHWFINHTVALHVNYEIDGKICGQTYTGFLLYYHERYMWVTAGHVIEDIDKLLKCDFCKVLGFKWVDNYEIDIAKAIPVDYERSPKCGINNKEIDLGIVGLEFLDIKAISAKNKNPWLTSKIWKNNHLANPDGYYVVGYPAEVVELKSSMGSAGTNCELKISLVCIPVERIKPEKPAHTENFWGHPGWFYGKILPVTREDGEYFDSISGMSGGPILSLERTPGGNIKYRLFAIQSGWLSQSKILCGTPIERVVELLDKTFEAVDKKADGDKCKERDKDAG